MSTAKYFILIVIIFIVAFIFLAGSNPLSFGEPYFRPRNSPTSEPSRQPVILPVNSPSPSPEPSEPPFIIMAPPSLPPMETNADQ